MKKEKMVKYNSLVSLLIVIVLIFQFPLSVMAFDMNKIDDSIKTADLSNAEKQNSIASNTEIKNTEVSNTEVKNTELHNTEILNTEIKNTEVHNTEIPNSEIKNTEVSNTEVSNSEIKNTEVSNTEVKNTEIHNSETSNTEVQNTEPAAADDNSSSSNNTESNEAILSTENKDDIPNSRILFDSSDLKRSTAIDQTVNMEQLNLEISNLNWKDAANNWKAFKKNGNKYEFTGTTFEQIKGMSLQLDFSIIKPATSDRTIREGDFFQVALPAAFRVTDVVTPQSLTYNSYTIANYTIMNNVINVIFTENVNWEKGLGSIKGGCGMEFKLDDNEFVGGYDGTIPLALQGPANTITITIPPKSTLVDGIEKKGEYHPDNGTITWKIKVGTLTPGQDISGIIIKDTFNKDNQEYQTITPVPDGFTNDNAGNISFQVPTGTTAPAEFILTTKVNSSLYNQAGDTVINNQVNMELPADSLLTLGSHKTASSDVTIPKVSITKEGTQINSEKMHWTIKVNASKGTIYNPIVTDDLTNSGKLDENSIKVDDKSVDLSSLQEGNISATLSTDLLTIYLTAKDQSTNATHTITFDTTVNADDMVNPNSKLKNEAKLSCNLFGLGGTAIHPSSGEIEGDFNTAYIKKSFQEFDKQNGFITWKLNPSVRVTGYNSAVINDTIQPDQEYVPGSVIIKSSGTAVGTDLYQVNYTQPQLSIVMDSTQKPDFNNWTITFQTRAKNYFNENTVGNDESKYHTYNNSATLTVIKGADTFTHTSAASTKQANHFLDKSTEFQYNAEDNSIYMHYTITVNADNADLGNIIVSDDLNLLTTDILTPAQADTGNKIAASDWELIKEKTKVTPSDVVPVFSGANDKKVTVDFGNKSNIMHQIEIFVRLKDDAKNKYLSTGNIVRTNNTAVARADKFNGGTDCSLISTGAGNGGQVINKLLDKKAASVVKDPSNKVPCYIPWTVTINPNGVVFRDKTDIQAADSVILKDIYPKGLRVDKTSIKRYGIDASGAVDKNKILDISSYDITPLEDGTTALSVSIPNDGKPCAIVYHTIIVEPIAGLKVTNKANLMIDGDERETSSKTASLSSADWGYLDYTAAFQIVKKDAVLGSALKGAVFGLYSDENCTELIDTKSTDTAGNLYFYALELNKPYYFKEIKAPEGYIINSTATKGTEIIATKPGLQTDKKAVIENERNKIGTIEFQKDFSDGATGLQADFQLTRKISGGDKTVHITGSNGEYTYTDDITAAVNITSKKDNGKVKVTGLPWGDYEMKEVKSHNGYKPETKIVKISILPNQTVTYDTKSSLTVTNQPILVSIKKTDMSGNAISSSQVFTVSGVFADGNGISADKVLNEQTGYALDKLLIAGNTYKLTETRPPDGYKQEAAEILLSAGADGAITVSGKDTVSAAADAVSGRTTITFKNEQTDFKVAKTDIAGTALDGAKFKVSGSFADKSTEKEVSPSKILDAQLKGQLIIGNTYIITETVAPEGYRKLTSPIHVKIQENGSLIIINQDDVKPLVLVKADAVTLQVKNEINYNEIWFGKLGTTDESDISKTAALDGAKFTLYLKSNPNEIAKDKSGVQLKDIESKNGKVSFKNVNTGEYIVKETQAPANYNQDTSQWYASISKEGEFHGLTRADNTPVVDNTIINQAIRGEVSLKKTDEDNPAKTLTGVTFGIYKNGENELFATAVTDNAGQIKFTNLLMDRQYTIREIATLGDYVLSDQKLVFTLKESEADSSKAVKKDLGVFTNAPVKLSFYRMVNSNQPLLGAVFGLYAADDKNFEHPLQLASSDVNGKLIFEHLDKTKKYIVKEVSVPSGYVPDTNTYTVTCDEKGYSSLWDADGDMIQVVDTSKGQITILKTESGSSTKYLKDTKFSIAEKNNKDSVIEEKATDENGKLIFKNLTMGTYIIKEVKAPDGYQLSSDVTEVTLSLGADQKQTISISNRPSTVSFIKYGKYTETCGPVPDAVKVLSNAAFCIYTADDKNFQSPIAKTVSGADGKVIFTGVKDGEYLIKEVSAPAGYQLSSAVYQAVVKDGFVKNITDESGRPMTDNAVINDPIRASFTFTKVDEKDHNKVLPGSTYGLYSTRSQIKGEAAKGSTQMAKNEDNNKETLISTQITGTDGRIVFEGLLLNTQYILRELAAPEGSLVSANPILFYFEQTDKDQAPILKLNDNGGGTVKINEDGSIIWLEPPTVVSILKTDLSGNILSGAKFTLKDKNGAIIGTWVSEKEAHIIQGKLIGGESYTLEETEAPEGYILAEPITFTVEAKPAGPSQDNTQHVILKNDTTKVSILKVDAATNKAISGASLELRDKNGHTVEEWVTDGGAHMIEGKLRASDTYTLVETKAPTGYELAESINITVKKDASILKVVMKDKKSESVTENTAKNNSVTPVQSNNARTGDAANAGFFILLLFAGLVIVQFGAKMRRN